jgi:hypothetical protein
MSSCICYWYASSFIMTFSSLTSSCCIWLTLSYTVPEHEFMYMLLVCLIFHHDLLLANLQLLQIVNPFLHGTWPWVRLQFLVGLHHGFLLVICNCCRLLTLSYTVPEHEFMYMLLVCLIFHHDLLLANLQLLQIVNPFLHGIWAWVRASVSGRSPLSSWLSSC